ncbi:MAG: ferrous iron transport protein B [Bacteroidota bacterium]
MIKVALVGNPNSGKSSLFNQLTGLNQKVGNFPGVTVDMKTGPAIKVENNTIELIDLPGTYSIYPRSLDERVVINLLTDESHEKHPDAVVVVVDASNLNRNLLLYSEVADLGLPTVLALNMMDVADKAGLQIDIQKLSESLGTEVVPINARLGTGLDDLKKAIVKITTDKTNPKIIYDAKKLAPEVVGAIADKFPGKSDYRAYQTAQQLNEIAYLSAEDKEWIAGIKAQYDFQDKRLQEQETLDRFEIIKDKTGQAVSIKQHPSDDSVSERLDRILTHKVYGYAIFLAILFLIFQTIFAWAGPFMDLIDEGFGWMSGWVQNYLPEGVLNDLLAEGIIPGLGGVVIFIPQIALLFLFIAILEESGYMARVVFLMDKVMVKFGLNGKSVVPLISGMACAIPAIMATRTIDSWKDRIITIFVTPFMSCSARLPVYAILIALVVPDEYVLGVFNLQGITLMAMYLLGFVLALLSAYVMKKLLKTNEKSYFMMELPIYRSPRWGNVGLTVFEKSKTFVFEAGKIILAISIVLWVLASYGPGEKFANAETIVSEQQSELSGTAMDDAIAAFQLEHSYAGILGKFIEPVIKPLGYDWKIGIALITSFAAREVFVGTIATIYSVGSDFEDEATIKSRLSAEINPDTGGPM